MNGFIGDNVRSAPNYSCVVKRTSLTNWGNNSEINDEINGDVNPSSALWYMLVNLIGLDKNVLDESSFINANKALVKEGLSLIHI